MNSFPISHLMRANKQKALQREAKNRSREQRQADKRREKRS